MIQSSLNQLNPNVPEFLKPYTERITAPVNTVTLAYHPGGFIFSEDMAKLLRDSSKLCVVLDFMEYGWDSSWDNIHIASVTYTEKEEMYGNTENQVALSSFLNDNGVLIYFKREFSAKLKESFSLLDLAGFPILPIELVYPNLPLSPKPDREEYLSRGKSVFSLCGDSHPDRKALAAHLKSLQARCHVEEIHYTQRRPLTAVMELQARYQASVCLPGAGVKTWRDGEACWNSVPIMADLGMEYRVKWGDDNAIMLPTKEGRILIPESLEKIQACLDDQEGMWQRMKLAHENAKRMEINNYMTEINKEIQDRL